MELYFLRHGLAGQRSAWSGDDAERPLTEEGRARMLRSAAAMSRLGILPDLILTSPLLRALQTAQIVAETLQLNDRLHREERLAPGFGHSQLGKLVRAHAGAHSIMLVGHEPDFSETIGKLTGGEVECKKGSLVAVEVTDVTQLRGRLVWLLPPRLLSL